MCSMSVLCPLCAQTSFSSIDALRCSLIKAANGPLACPICHDFFLGLDKLTIHLFSHTTIMNSANNSTKAAANANASTPATANATTSTPAAADGNQNFKNNEEFLKTHQSENMNNINNNSSKCTETKTHTQTQSTDEQTIFENSHHFWEKNMLKKSKEAESRDKANINKSNSTQQQQQQQQQVVTTPERDQEEPRELENLAQCDICEFTFRNEELRNMHIRLVHQNFEYHSNTSAMSENQVRPTNPSSAKKDTHNCSVEHDFKCHLCSKTFKTKGSLRVHLKVVHLMGQPYASNAPKLSICDRIRHKENKMLKSANPNHNNAQIQTESITSTTSATELKTSNSCSLFNITPVNFMSTLNTIPAATNISVLNLNQPLDFQQNNLDNSTLPTSNVLLVFNSSAADMDPSLNAVHNSVTAHAAADVLAIVSKDNEPTQKVTSNMANVTENPKIWECDVCSKAFTTKYFLKKHKRLHTGEMPYTCELCARTFTFQQSYHKHLLYHSDEKPHVCATCGRAFKELSTLHNHERIHSGEKPFKCEICDKSFRQRVSFLVHTRIHTGVMPYKCEICQRSFRYKVSQRTHKCLPLTTEESPPPQNEENTIDKMSENFIKAFLETSTTNQTDQHINQSQTSPASNEIAAINEKETLLNEQQALLTKTIDDIVVESCNKMGIGSDGIAAEQNLNEGSMSPSQKLQNMRLYSPQLLTPDLNGIEGDLTRFFLENSQIGNQLL